MTDRNARLRKHIEDTVGPAIIGVDDCGPWVVQWIERETGRKVSFPKYATPAEAYTLAAKAGGMVALVEPLLATVPLWRTNEPVQGDVGIIRLSDRDTAVIFCGNGIAAVRDESNGVRYIRPRDVLMAWSLP